MTVSGALAGIAGIGTRPESIGSGRSSPNDDEQPGVAAHDVEREHAAGLLERGLAAHGAVRIEPAPPAAGEGGKAGGSRP